MFGTETIYARAMALQSGPGSLNINSIISHELAPYPAKTKATLKNDLKVVASCGNAKKDVVAVLLDGCAMLWTIL